MPCSHLKGRYSSLTRVTFKDIFHQQNLHFLTSLGPLASYCFETWAAEGTRLKYDCRCSDIEPGIASCIVLAPIEYIDL